jgi:tetratricopeptide (TPR) repeat protein
MQQFLQLEPDSAQSHATASEVLKRLGKTEEASQFARGAMQMNPADPLLHNSLAQLKLKQRNYDEAQRHFESAAEIYQSRQEGQKGLQGIEIQSLLGQGAISFRKRQFQLAEAQYRRVTELAPQHPAASAMLAAAIGAQHRFDEALNLARGAADQNPEKPVCKIVLAELLSETEQFEEACSIARGVAELQPESYLPHLAMASIYLNMEKYADALEEAEKARAMHPEPLTRRALAVALAGAGDRERANEEIELVLKEEPEVFSSHLAAGWAYYLLHEFAEAELHLSRAKEMDVSGVGCDGLLGLVYLALEKPEQAAPLLENYYTRNPYQRRVREALQQIKGGIAPPPKPEI